MHFTEPVTCQYIAMCNKNWRRMSVTEVELGDLEAGVDLGYRHRIDEDRRKLENIINGG